MAGAMQVGCAAVRYEPPRDLLRRLRLGREEFCQRLLTMLILDGPYPKWNSRSRPSAAGQRFLAGLHHLSFGTGDWPADGVFVDELELAKRHDAEPGGAPDWAVLWPDRVWIVELKTERASHRPPQIPSYFDLARHHHPGCAIDITYLTPPLSPAVEPPAEWARFAHVTWDEIVPLLRDVWGGTADDAVRTVFDRVLETIATLRLRPSEWRESYLAAEPAAPEAPVEVVPQVVPAEPTIVPVVQDGAVAAAVALAEQTSRDGTQRALEFSAANLEELQHVRLAVRLAICATPDGSPLRHVMPWLWSTDSGGRPLTRAGAETGYELRLSRYAKPVC
jgi:hypothetical protein